VASTTFAACAERPAPREEGLSPSPSAPAASVTASPTSSPAVESPETAEELIDRFQSQGYPRLHGILVSQVGRYEEITYDMWIDAPRLWVNVVGSLLGPWISDGETTNISEPHGHIGALLLTDPFNVLVITCDDTRVIGHDRHLGRSSTMVRCRRKDADSDRTVWLDDATGLVLAGESSTGGGWGFTELEIDPVFPEGIFDLHPEPNELWFEVPTGPSLGPADDAIDRAIAVFDTYPPLRGSIVTSPRGEDDVGERFDLYVQGGDLRVDVVIPGTTYPWVGTTDEQPPYPYTVTMGLDPGFILGQCRAPEVLAHEEVLGRAATAISCPDYGVTGLDGESIYSVRVLWVDDGTGMILRGYYEESWGEHVGWFGFTELELDPQLPPETFEVTPVLVPYANAPGPD
jgi:hypothetical protein